MTHVVLRKAKTDSAPGAYEFIVDGVDMTPHTLREGFRIELSEDYFQPARIHCTIAADTLEADLPDAVLEAVRAEEEDVA